MKLNFLSNKISIGTTPCAFVITGRQARLWRPDDDGLVVADDELLLVHNDELWLWTDPDRPKMAPWFEQLVEASMMNWDSRCKGKREDGTRCKNPKAGRETTCVKHRNQAALTHTEEKPEWKCPECGSDSDGCYCRYGKDGEGK